MVDYHLVAGIPTPNGPLHLGHVGGPFLRMDVLARYQRMHGNRAYLISGTDAYESYVAVASARSGVPPSAIARRYHGEISADLAAVDVVHDAFIDPLDPHWSARYGRWHDDLLAGLRVLGRVECRAERVLHSGRYLFGGFLAGRCPECERPVVGTSCEECGAWFSPQTILDPTPSLPSREVEWRAVTNLFLRLDEDELRRVLADPDLRPEHRRVVEDYLAREGPYWRLTQQSDCGVPAPAEVTAPGVYSTYGLGILAYAALCGEEYGLLSGRGDNALAAGSGVVTVSAQGFDSIIPDVFAIVALRMLAPRLSDYRYLTFNRFVLLEGRKFSTSRRHAIWTREFTDAVPSDLVRHYLARIAPDEKETDFRVNDFVALANKYIVDGLHRRAVASWRVLDAAIGGAGAVGVDAAVGAPAGRLVERFETLLLRQGVALDPARPRLAEVVAALDEWPDAPGTDPEQPPVSSAAYWWLKGAALLAWSVLPRWALATWRCLGHDGEPTLAAFGRTPPLAAHATRPGFEPLDAAAVQRLVRIGPTDG